jgi:deoxycytidine triphosphate deaminase
MFGNIINNAQIRKLRDENELTLSPFREERLKLAHYALSPAGILWAGAKNSKGKRELQPKHDFESDDKYTFQPGEYAIIEVEEFIKLPDGIVGHFLPSSTLIESGFGLTAGKLDPKYGEIGGRRQKLIFGLKNLRNDPNTFSAAEGLAHIYFIDLRGLNSVSLDFSNPEVQDYLRRFPHFKRAHDDGPSYE